MTVDADLNVGEVGRPLVGGMVVIAACVGEEI